MKRILRIVLLAVVALTLSTHMPAQRRSNTSVFQDANIQSQLDALAKRGFTYRFLDPTTIKLTETWSGMKQVKSLNEPSEAEVRAWAAVRGVPILEVDPNLIDTTNYSGWYIPWVEIPLSNDIAGPLIVNDFDDDKNVEVYGSFKDWMTDFESRVYEVGSSGIVSLVHQYLPRSGPARAIVDSDKDSLLEVTYTLAGVVSDYEQSSNNSLPVALNFQHDRHFDNWDPGFTGIFFGSLDGDSFTDLLYKGSEPDSSDSTMGISKIYVAEYDSSVNNFVRVWSTQYYPGAQSGIGGFVVNDFDGDGKAEFVATDLLSGTVYVTENTGNNSFTQTWSDDTPFNNMYYQGEGDVDNDGNLEFFVGATMSTGNWTTMYETDGDNHFTPRLIFHLLSGGIFDNPNYMSVDLDNDGLLELIIFSGIDLYVFKSNANDSYYLWYYKRENTKDGIQVFDFNRDGIKDLIISKTIGNNQGDIRFYSDIYLGTNLVAVSEAQSLENIFPYLGQNYPNPFNPITTISYYVPVSLHVRITVVSVLGQEVAELTNNLIEAGRHSISWDATGKPSGAYLCRMEAGGQVFVNKMVLAR